MSATENVQCSILVTVMNSTAISALPCSYSDSCDTFGATDASAIRTGTGSIGLFDFLIPATTRNRFVVEHQSEVRPSGIKYRLCHFSLGKPGNIDVPYDNMAILVGQ